MFSMKKNGYEMIGHERGPMKALARQHDSCWHLLVTFFNPNGTVFREEDFILPDRAHVIEVMGNADAAVHRAELKLQRAAS